VAKYMYTAIRIGDRFGLHFVLLTEHATAGWRVRDFEHCPVDPLGPGDLPGATPASLKREADRVIPVDPHPVTTLDDCHWWQARLHDLQRRYPLNPSQARE